MKKKLLLFGASVSTAVGMTLLVLFLMLTSAAYASTETTNPNCSKGTCTSYATRCAESNCMSYDANCECPRTGTCACVAVKNTKR